ncbi:MAG TPA: alpha-L-arabinofuranosidase C-terminal domain-containing protein [Sedimentisphaerales bacterium]|nr:alpha-L-arabinofuranosidase C-terminal domain-containing protein [Sedimentisphaerales bacterium]
MFRVRYAIIGIVTAVVLAGMCRAGLAAETEGGPAHKATLMIEAGKTGEPVSKYIYGQFIEHLGRCIYGGIWAEMLEDRKFYYPMPAEGPIWQEHKGTDVLAASPWQVIGEKDAVKMVRENSYVGEHTPQIELRGDGTCCGIFQDRLGLVKGKRYTGRIVIEGSPKAAPIEVSLVWGQDKTERQTLTIKKIGSDFVKVPLSFKAGGTTDNGRLEIAGKGKGIFQIGTVSLMPADNIKGMRADTLKLLKELNSPIYRWPGGNFVSGYDWRDGIGERDKRPPRKNPAWTGIEHNDFGLDEFMAFCREVGAEPLIVVNSGFGDDHSAGQEVEYANGSPETPMGRWRAANGHRRPYKVKWWGIGNEMYGKWQLGYMSLEHYAQKHNLFAKAMRKADPSIRLVGVGDVGRWSEGMLKNCAEYMDLISEHFYKREKKAVTEHVRQTVDAVRSKVEAHRKWRNELESLKGKDIRIALDEWNYWYGPYVYGELGTRYFLKDALGIATGLNEMIRNSDIVFMANYAQTVNVIGCIKTSKTDAAFAATGLALKLYRNRFGTQPVAVSGNFEPLDVAAAWTSDREALTVAIVNPTESAYKLKVDLKDARLRGRGQLWQIAGSDPMAYNEPGKPRKLVIEEKPMSGIPNELSVPPLSVCLYKLPAR